MNAITSIVAADQPSRLERAHRATISTVRPGEPEDRLEYRVQLAVLRDKAASGIDRASPEAATLLQYIASNASVAVYSAWGTRKLFAVYSALELTMMAARSIQWAAQVDG